MLLPLATMLIHPSREQSRVPSISGTYSNVDARNERIDREPELGASKDDCIRFVGAHLVKCAAARSNLENRVDDTDSPHERRGVALHEECNVDVRHTLLDRRGDWQREDHIAE